MDPDIARFAQQLAADWRRHPPLDTLPVAEARIVAERVRARWAAGGPAMAETHDLTIATGAGPLRVRIHRPTGADRPAPGLVYLHGGGFVLFSIDTHDRLMREYAAGGGFAVIGVDYPLSPEARFPVALDAITALMLWLAEHGRAIGIDGARLAIGGDSAGANLAFACCLRLRDAGRPTLIRAILTNYAALSGTVSDAAEAAHGGPGALLDRAEMRYFFDAYLGDPALATDPLACPIHADVTGLPPTILVIPECDVLTEQSIAMRDRLIAAGVAVEAKIYAGATHSFLEAMSISALARGAIADGWRFVKVRL
jgi:acetyl esterase